MRPKELITAYVEAFNRVDADALANFYSETAINHAPKKTRDNFKGAERLMKPNFRL